MLSAARIINSYPGCQRPRKRCWPSQDAQARSNQRRPRLDLRGHCTFEEDVQGPAFTIDGRLVGDIGEVIAALEYDVTLFETSQPDHDGVTSDGRRVQVKATFQEKLTFKTVPEYYLGFKLSPDGRHEEISMDRVQSFAIGIAIGRG